MMRCRTRLNLGSTAATLVALAGCGAEPGAPELLVPQEVHVAWEQAYNGVDDGLGALVPVDVMAYDGATGEPLADVPVEVFTDDAAALPLPIEAVLVMMPTDAPVDRQLEAQLAELGLAVEDPGAPAVEADEPARPIAWDASRDQYVVFERDETTTGGIELLTDTGGVARLYVYVDAFPESPPSTLDDEVVFLPVRVVVSMGDVDQLFTVSPR